MTVSVILSSFSFISAVSALSAVNGFGASNGPDLLVLAEDAPQPVADLAQRGVGLDRLEEGRHQVVAAARRVGQPGQGPLGRAPVPARPPPPHPRDLVPL